MTIGEWLATATQKLQAVGIETARLDALVLLEDAASVDRTRLLAHPEEELSSDTQNVLSAWLVRRVQHEPLAYIRGKSEFYGREFAVSPAVLVPRPETETMIDLLKTWINRHSEFVSEPRTLKSGERKILNQVQDDASGGRVTIMDVGTGSGALAITAASEVSGAEVWGLDIDPECLQIAQENTKMHDVKITLAESDLLELQGGEVFPDPTVLLCNLPYVPDEYAINDAARHEPALALFAGADGLDLYRKLFEQSVILRTKPLLILTESLETQHLALRQLAKSYGYEEESREGLIQAFVLA